MYDHECNIFANLSKFEFHKVRGLIIEMVLGTGDWAMKIIFPILSNINIYFLDMSMHFSQLKQLKQQLQGSPSGDRYLKLQYFLDKGIFKEGHIP